jgi:DNA polymerase III subunit alpha
MKKKNTTIPFVGLHAHSVAGSIFDALGYPQEHMDFAYENGMDALALTDHGNLNGLPHQVLHAKKMKDAGKEFKPIFGVEAYFLPSLDEWREDYEKAKEDKKKRKTLSKDVTATTVEDEEASKKSVRNILNRRRHLILLAQDQEGLNNLFAMISESFGPDNYYRYPRVDYKTLKKYSKGVIGASACLGGVYAGNYWENREEGELAVLSAMRETTKQMIDVFGDRWYGELQWNNIPEQHELNKYIIKMHEEFGIELVSTSDSHYPNPNAWRDRELYKKLGWLGKPRPGYESSELPSGVEEIGYELYPRNGNQMWEAYKKYSESCGVEYDDDLVMNSITNTYRIAHERIEDFLPDNTVRLPDFVIPAGETADSALEKFCIEGLRGLGLHIKEEYTDRLRMELEVISDRGFSKYFLTMNQVSQKANEVMLAGPGRGSAAGSLVAYALNITQVDPLKYGLQFSRFMRSDATDYPDIDYDVADSMGLKEILIREWGEDKVAPISNWNTLQLKSLIKDISKFYGISFSEVNDVTSVMMTEAIGPAKMKHGIKTGIYNPTFEEVMEFSSTLKGFLSRYPHVKTHVEVLYGQVRSCSRHAGGIVIGEDLNSRMPLINSGGVRQTPWSEGQNVRHLEPMGFIKFDVLGLSTLKMIDGAIYHILRRHHGIENPTFEDIKSFYDKNLHPDVMDFSDQKVYKNIFHAGKWAGVFQFTEAGAQRFCQQAKPTNLIDLAAITSIYRPGPLGANVHNDYVEARNNPHRINFFNDEHRSVTEETFGFLIFQEQIAELAHRLGKDLSLDEGNALRKVLTKKGTGKEAQVKKVLRSKFLDGCEERGLQSGTGEGLWKTFEYFSGYGFNKSHAVSYCIISFQCAWLLNYYQVEWLAAFLDKEPETRKERAINVAKSFGLEIKSLNVNSSGRVWEISDDGKTLIQPLSSIKGLGDAAIDQITLNRPFNTVEEFLFNESITYSKLNKKSLDVLCRSGALDCLVDKRFTGAKHFWTAICIDRPRKEKNLIENIENPVYSEEGDFSDEEKIGYLVQLTGVFPFNKVMKPEIYKQLNEAFIPPIANYDPELCEVVWFIPRTVTTKRTKNGKPYWILEVVDDTNTLTRIRCWGVQQYDRIHINKPYMAKLEYNEKWGFSTRSLRRNFRVLA